MDIDDVSQNQKSGCLTSGYALHTEMPSNVSAGRTAALTGGTVNRQ
jgi:hypothetical protein